MNPADRSGQPGRVHRIVHQNRTQTGEAAFNHADDIWNKLLEYQRVEAAEFLTFSHLL